MLDYQVVEKKRSSTAFWIMGKNDDVGSTGSGKHKCSRWVIKPMTNVKVLRKSVEYKSLRMEEKTSSWK